MSRIHSCLNFDYIECPKLLVDLCCFAHVLTTWCVTCSTLPAAAEEYFNNNVLNLSDGIDDLGAVQPHLVLSLFIAWLVVGAALIKGIKSSGKV